VIALCALLFAGEAVEVDVEVVGIAAGDDEATVGYVEAVEVGRGRRNADADVTGAAAGRLCAHRPRPAWRASR